MDTQLSQENQEGKDTNTTRSSSVQEIDHPILGSLILYLKKYPEVDKYTILFDHLERTVEIRIQLSQQREK